MQAEPEAEAQLHREPVGEGRQPLDLEPEPPSPKGGNCSASLVSGKGTQADCHMGVQMPELTFPAHTGGGGACGWTFPGTALNH